MADPVTPTPAAPKAYSTADTKRLLKMVASHNFDQHPFGEFVSTIADQLRMADEQILSTGTRELHSEMKADRIAKDLRETEGLLLKARNKIRELEAKLPKDSGDDCI